MSSIGSGYYGCDHPPGNPEVGRSQDEIRDTGIRDIHRDQGRPRFRPGRLSHGDRSTIRRATESAADRIMESER